MHEGPTLVSMRPANLSCLGCRWHEQRTIWSGHDSGYDHRCSHPLLPRTTIGTIPHDETDFVNLRKIGGTPVTPDWCPVLENKP